MKKCLFVVLILAGICCAEEPVRFRGAYIGQPLSDWVSCNGNKAKVLLDGYKLHGKVCSGEKGILRHTRSVGVMTPKIEGEAFIFENQHVVQIKIMMQKEDWEKVRFDLTQKLGEPASEVPQVFQNGYGARWEFAKAFWTKENLVAFARVKVATIGNNAITGAFSNQPETEGVEVTISDAAFAKSPTTTANSLD